MAEATRPGKAGRCEHFAEIRDVAPRMAACEECTALGTRWNELRVCLSCGHVGCCEDSPHAHALAHFRATGHAMIASLSRNESWGWCYVHGRYFDPMPPLAFRRRSPLRRLLDRLRGGSPSS